MNFIHRTLSRRVTSFVFALFLLSVGMSSVAQANGRLLNVSYLEKPSLAERAEESDVDVIWMFDQSPAGLRLNRLSEHAGECMLSQLSVVRTSNQRARSAHIGSVMAVLATFDEAHVLPPEYDPQANQLIHTLIQLQSAVMKSHNAEFRAWVSDAAERKFQDFGSEVLGNVRDNGLTMDFLEAMIDYSEIHPPWRRSGLVQGFQAFNVQREDWVLLRKVLLDARAQLAIHGEQLSEVFARRRLEMPGAVR